MKNNKQQVTYFLNREPMLRVQALEALKRGKTDILAKTDGGVLLIDREIDMPLLCADTLEDVRALLPSIPETGILTNDLEAANGLLSEALGYDSIQVCTNVVYQSKQPIDIQTDVVLAPLPMKDAELIKQNYDIHTLDEILAFIRQGRLLGGYVGDELVGFLGWHEDGSMGMLHVFKQHRRKGCAYAMEALQINLMLSRNELPWGQVIVGNDASLALQKKLGFTVEEKKHSWLFKTE